MTRSVYFSGSCPSPTDWSRRGWESTARAARGHAHFPAPTALYTSPQAATARGISSMAIVERAVAVFHRSQGREAAMWSRPGYCPCMTVAGSWQNCRAK